MTAPTLVNVSAASSSYNEATLVEFADLGVVGDALQLLPVLIDEVRSRKGD